MVTQKIYLIYHSRYEHSNPIYGAIKCMSCRYCFAVTDIEGSCRVHYFISLKTIWQKRGIPYSALFSRRLNFEIFADLIIPAKIAPLKLT